MYSKEEQYLSTSAADFFRQCEVLPITFNGNSSFTEAEKNIQHAVAVRLLHSHFSADFSVWEDWKAEFSVQQLTISAALHCIWQDNKNQPLLVLMDEFQKCGIFQTSLLTYIGAELSHFPPNKLHIITVALDAIPFQNGVTTPSGRSVFWIPLAPLESATSLKLMDTFRDPIPDFVRRQQSFKWCVAEVNGHPRTLEIVAEQVLAYIQTNSRRNSNSNICFGAEAINSTLTQVISDPRFRLSPSIGCNNNANKLLEACFLARPSYLGAMIGEFNISHWISLGVLLSPPTETDIVYPTINCLLLRYLVSSSINKC